MGILSESRKTLRTMTKKQRVEVPELQPESYFCLTGRAASAASRISQSKSIIWMKTRATVLRKTWRCYVSDHMEKLKLYRMSRMFISP